MLGAYTTSDETAGALAFGRFDGCAAWLRTSYLANEAKDKLSRLRPRTLGHAARIAGVLTPDIALFAIHVERRRRMGETSRHE